MTTVKANPPTDGPCFKVTVSCTAGHEQEIKLESGVVADQDWADLFAAQLDGTSGVKMGTMTEEQLENWLSECQKVGHQTAGLCAHCGSRTTAKAEPCDP